MHVILEIASCVPIDLFGFLQKTEWTIKNTHDRQHWAQDTEGRQTKEKPTKKLKR